MEPYERLKEVREAHGYSELDVAKHLRTTVRQVRRWERGEVAVRFRVYVALAKLYGLSIDYLSGLTDEPRRLERPRR